MESFLRINVQMSNGIYPFPRIWLEKWLSLFLDLYFEKKKLKLNSAIKNLTTSINFSIDKSFCSSEKQTGRPQKIEPMQSTDLPTQLPDGLPLFVHILTL